MLRSRIPMFLFLIASSFGTSAEALRFGNLPSHPSSVLRFYVGEGLRECAGVVVGLNPPTVLTARHCANAGPLYLADVLLEPKKIITLDYPGANSDFSYTLMALDVAVLIFAKKDFLEQVSVRQEDVFSVAPRDVGWGQTVVVCGFGGITHDPKKKVCGTSRVLTENADFAFPLRQFGFESRGVADKYGFLAKNPIEMMSERDRTQVVHAVIQGFVADFNPLGWLAIASFTDKAYLPNPDGGYDEAAGLVSVEPGDSGGPMFIHQDGTNYLIASISRNFEGRAAAALAWRMDHPWTRKLFAKARKLGADIRGM